VGFVFPDDFTPTDHSKKVIDTLTGQKRRTGTTLQPVTDEVSAHRVLGHEKYGNKLVLVDTPGFDNTHESDKQILEMIGRWMITTYVGVPVHEIRHLRLLRIGTNDA